MKLYKIMPLVSLLFLLGACQDQPEVAEEEAVVVEEVPSADEVITRWAEAWNSGDAQNVENMTADDAVLLLNGTEVPRDSIAAWLEFSGNNMRDLEMVSDYQGAQGQVAYDSGTYRHGFANDTTIYNGTYTFIWERAEGEPEDWKVKVIHISGADEEVVEDIE